MIDFIKKYKIFVLGGIVILIMVPLIFSSLSQPSSLPDGTTVSPSPASSTGQQKISPLQRNTMGQTPEVDPPGQAGFLGKEALPNGREKYIYESPLNARPNETILEKGVVVFEKDLTPESPTAQGYTLLSQIKSIYGAPERIIKGSKFYGPFLNQYVYASYGFSLVANPNNDEVYEINFFKPTSVERYISDYADDITSNNTPVVE